MLCDELNETAQIFPVLYGLLLYHLYAAELSEAQAVANRLLQLAAGTNDRGRSFFAHRAAGVAALPVGEFERGRGHLDEALSLYDPAEHKAPAFVYAFEPRVVCLDYLARTLLPLGFPEQALAANREAVSEARKGGHRNSLALPLFFGGVIRQVLGETEGVAAHARELSQIAAEAGFQFWQAGAGILQAWCTAESGDLEHGSSKLEDGIAGWRAAGGEYMVPYFLALRSDIEGRAGNTATALRLLEEARSLVDRTGERWFAAEILRLEGETLLRVGEDGGTARERFLAALATARAQKARFWELRAATSLARAEQSEKSAREQLARIYSGFTEGLHLADLKAAQSLAASGFDGHRVQ
jgi:predicted ATPase